MAERAWLDLILRLKKEGKGPEQVEKALKGVEKQTKKTSTAADGMKKAFGMAFGAVSVGMIFKTGAELFNLAEEVDQAERALEGFAGSSQAAALILETVEDAAHGTVDKFTAMQMAAKLLSMGLASNAKEAGELTDVAITLGTAMGKDAKGAFEDFTLMLANQSLPRLDTFGIASGKVRERINELTEEFPELDRSVKFTMATMEIAREKMDKLEEAGYVAGTTTERLKTTWENWKIEAADTLEHAILPVLEAFEKLNELLPKAADDTEDYGYIVLRSGQIVDEYGKYLARNVDEYRKLQMAQAVALGTDYSGPLAALTGDLSGVAGAAGEAAANIDLITAGIIGTSQAEIGAQAMRDFQAAAEAGLIDDQEEYDTAFKIIAEGMLGIDPAQVDASLAMAQFNKDLKDTGDIDNYMAHVSTLIQRLRTLARLQGMGGKAKFHPGGGRLQYGGSFAIGGAPGPDRVPVMFMGTAGEQVTVTPKQNVRAGDTNRSLTIENVHIHSGMDLEQFKSMLKRTLQ